MHALIIKKCIEEGVKTMEEAVPVVDAVSQAAEVEVVVAEAVEVVVVNFRI